MDHCQGEERHARTRVNGSLNIEAMDVKDVLVVRA